MSEPFNKSNLFTAGGILILAVVLIFFLLITLYKKSSEIAHRVELTERIALQNNLLLKGYREVFEPGINFSGKILFIGHIYTKNGFESGKKRRFVNIEKPLKFLRRHISKKNPPSRIVFGGDNVYRPTSDALRHLAKIRSRLPTSRFLLGNHDKYWKISRQPELFSKIYDGRYYFEDVDGVRFVYLHSEKEEKVLGIDSDQKEFLQRTLAETNKFRYSLVFLHHALWAGNSEYVNSKYSNAGELMEDWRNNILPLLQKGKVRGVFAGDGGWVMPGTMERVGHIPHYVTGWGYVPEIPPEWLQITPLEEGIQTQWQKLILGKLLVKDQIP